MWRRGAPSLLGARLRDPACPPDQVFNARDSKVNVAAVSDAAADEVKNAWAPLVPGQSVPLIWERVYDDDSCDCR